MAANSRDAGAPKPQIQPCRYKTGKTLGAGSYSVVKECVHIDTGRYYAAKVINKRMMQGREHMVRRSSTCRTGDAREVLSGVTREVLMKLVGAERDRRTEKGVHGP